MREGTTEQMAIGFASGTTEELQFFELTITPKQLARLFCNLGDKEQAIFLASVSTQMQMGKSGNAGAIIQHDLIGFAVDELRDPGVRRETIHMLEQWNNGGREG